MIPKKFKKFTKTAFVTIASAEGEKRKSSFSVFPRNVEYYGMEENEEPVLIVRRSLGAMIKPVASAVLLVFLVGIAVFAIISSFSVGSGAFNAGLAGVLIMMMFVINLALEIFVKWFYSVNIVTDERVVDVDFINMLYHTFHEAQLEHIEDVSHSVSGLLGSIFDFGTVRIQTAGAIPEIAFEQVPRPQDVQDVIHDLLELKQEGKI